MEERNKCASVADFYAGKSVFITGATGFLGMATTERILYNCTAIDKIYVLIRDSKGLSAEQRTRKITDSPLFMKLKEKRPHDLNKLIPISGDITAPNLGIKPEDEEILIQKVSVVIHLAATVKFNEPLKEALLINVEGTRKILDLCRRIKNLTVYIHISTAFTNTDKAVIDEIIYPPPAEIDEVYKSVNQEKYNEKAILNGRPNTYTFTKALAETLIEKYHGNIPTIIIRPSIVTAIKEEPLQGWINNWYGASGLLTSSAKGLNRIIIGKRNNIIDIVPVDYVVNFIIIAGAMTNKSPKLSVYNCCSSSCNPITIEKLLKMFTVEVKKDGTNIVPFPHINFFTQRRWVITVLTLLLQKIPAFTLDLKLRIEGKKTRYQKLLKLVILARDALEYFTSHSWVMKCAGVQKLYASLSEQDRRLFPSDPADIDWEYYVPIYYKGIKRYLEKKGC